jgi:TolA-binding protein
MFAQDREAREMEILADTLFQTMSIDEIKAVQKEYNERVGRLHDEEQSMRVKGMEVSESFLAREGSAISDQDRILIKIAEYYIEEAGDDFFKRLAEHEKLETEYFRRLELYDQGKLEQEPVAPEFPLYDYSRAIEVYDKISNEYPQSQYADDVLYSKAFLMAEMKKGVESRRLFQEVIDRYPDSHFAAESYMRLAEYFFDPRQDKDSEQSLVELQKAIKLYKKVLQYPDSKRYDEALYKLGWSYYRMTGHDPKYYTDAIVHFLKVVDDVTRAEELDPRKQISNPSVRNEAIQYIGISFADEEFYANAGVQSARRFIEKIGGRPYGVEIMRALGETHQKVENNDRALEAYETLLDMYPLYEEAPLIAQKVADTYFAKGNDELEYQTRYNLFKNYNPKSEWFAHITGSEIPNKLNYLKAAEELSEKSLYNNLAIDIQKAQEAEAEGSPETIPLYVKTSAGCEEYLDVFPADSNAYEINWTYALILDEKLIRFADAYEQYLRVSNDYLETEHQEAAANNAIFMAETLVVIAFGPQADTAVVMDISQQEALRPEVLTTEERRQIVAYENYIKLFSDGANTPMYLARAGGIFFQHKQFAEAKVYFNTLIKRFPGAKEKSIAMQSIMNSYFFLGKFRDSEVIAKRILNDMDAPDEQKVFAKQRLAQAVYKNAKLYEDQGQYLEAAQEFHRVFLESPEDRTYVDASLFNAGYNYDKIKEWEKAIEMYMLLVDNYPDSEYNLRCLQTTAEDYKELKRFTDAGKTYERVYNLYKDNKEVAEPSLTNASYYYERGEDWENAIRVNNQYVAVYPDEPLAVEMFFANAGHYLKMDNLSEANRIYDEFAVRYPDDMRAVESFFRRGEYYREHSQQGLAKAEYEKAIGKSEEFNRKGLDPNRFYVGEALNSLVKMQREEYSSITLTQPQSNIESQQARMSGLVKSIVENNKKIIANGSIRSFEAAYNSAEVYEEFADIYSVQERPANLSSDQLFAENKRINNTSAQLYQTAVQEYKQVYENIPKIAEKFEVDIFAADTVSKESAEAVVDTDTAFVIKRAVKVDSTKEVALKWYTKSANKISSLLYKQAEITKNNIEAALATEVPAMSPFQTLLFKVQVVSKVLAPDVKNTIDAHLRNIAEAEELGLHNKYVEESKRQILLISNILAEEVEKIAFDAIKSWPEQSSEMMRLIELEYGTTNNQGFAYTDVHNGILQMIDLSKELAKAAMKNYTETLILAQNENIQNDLIRTTEMRMMRLAIELTDYYTLYHDSALARHGRYLTRFDSTSEDDPLKYNYDDANIYFQDQSFNLEDYSRVILDEAFILKDEYQIVNLWANKLLLRLFTLDPATYAASMEKEKFEFMSGEEWNFSKTRIEGYHLPGFDDSGWKNAGTVPSAYNQFIDLDVNPPAMWIAKPKPAGAVIDSTDSLQTAFSDSLTGDDSSTIGSESIEESQIAADTDSLMGEAEFSYMEETGDTVEVYFRRLINFDGTPVEGTIYMTADDDFRLFINGEYIIDDIDDSFAVLDTVSYYDISYYLTPGENLFAIHVVDLDNSAGGVKLYGNFELLPSDVSASVEEKARVKQLAIDPVVLKRINTLNKNRITLKD